MLMSVLPWHLGVLGVMLVLVGGRRLLFWLMLGLAAQEVTSQPIQNGVGVYGLQVFL